MGGKSTMRRSCRRYNSVPTSLEFSDVERTGVMHDDGSMEIAVSSIDLLLKDTDNFILKTASLDRSQISDCCKNGNLNKGCLWDSVLEELENTCISKNERPSSGNAMIETVYTVPVIGYKFFLPPADDEDFELGAYHELRLPDSNSGVTEKRLSNATKKKIKMNPAQFLFWEGKYYDATKVYVFRPELSNYLKPIGVTVAPKASILTPDPSVPSSLTLPHSHSHTPHSNSHHRVVEFVKHLTYHSSGHQREQQHSCRLLHQGQGQGTPSYGGQMARAGGWLQRDSGDYLEINLGYPRCITHIGTAGAYPATTTFPTRKVVGKRRMRRFREDGESLETHLLSQNGNGVRVDKFARYVQVLKQEEQELSWVTAYEVHYRNVSSHKWISLGAFGGNCDAFSEALLDLSPHFNAKHGLLTQYLRLRPLESRNKPILRVSVYGIDPILSARENNATATAGVNVGDGTSLVTTSKGREEEEEVPTISYAVVQSSARSGPIYVRDGLTAYYYRDDWQCGDSKKPRALKMKNFGMLMKEQSRPGSGYDS